jgi:FlaA1/EpsC-like NDP-sugar epimerase
MRRCVSPSDAGAIGDSGEVMVLGMGEPFRIADVAARYADQCTPPR